MQDTNGGFVFWLRRQRCFIENTSNRFVTQNCSDIWSPRLCVQNLDVQVLLSSSISVSAYCVPGTAQGARDPKMKKIQKYPGLKELTLLGETNIIFKNTIWYMF